MTIVISSRKSSAFEPNSSLALPKRLIGCLSLVIGTACGQAAPEACPATARMSCPPAALTFDSGIATLIQARCLPCHDVGGVAVTPLLTDYTQVFNARRGIGPQLLTCAMPPSGAPPLSAAERQQILDWLACDAPR